MIERLRGRHAISFDLAGHTNRGLTGSEVSRPGGQRSMSKGELHRVEQKDGRNATANITVKCVLSVE